MAVWHRRHLSSGRSSSTTLWRAAAGVLPGWRVRERLLPLTRRASRTATPSGPTAVPHAAPSWVVRRGPWRPRCRRWAGLCVAPARRARPMRGGPAACASTHPRRGGAALPSCAGIPQRPAGPAYGWAVGLGADGVPCPGGSPRHGAWLGAEASGATWARDGWPGPVAGALWAARRHVGLWASPAGGGVGTLEPPAATGGPGGGGVRKGRTGAGGVWPRAVPRQGLGRAGPNARTGADATSLRSSLAPSGGAAHRGR
jgi:hypothetical protein